MQRANNAMPPGELAPLFPEQHPDDGSSHLHRQLIGYLGAALPPLVWLIAGCRGAGDATPWHLLPSISDYYYTGSVSAFVGLLVALGLVLLTYGGYINQDGHQDLWAARIAGLAALLVAAFPTRPGEGVPAPAWWEPVTGTIHIGSAVVLFLAFAYFALILFRKGKGPRDADKRVRNRIYLVCGVTILLAWAGTVALHFTHHPIFWPEAVMLWAFATSWLVKGRADVTLKALVHNAVKEPRKAAKALVSAVKGRRA